MILSTLERAYVLHSWTFLPSDFLFCGKTRELVIIFKSNCLHVLTQRRRETESIKCNSILTIVTHLHVHDTVHARIRQSTFLP